MQRLTVDLVGVDRMRVDLVGGHREKSQVPLSGLQVGADKSEGT